MIRLVGAWDLEGNQDRVTAVTALMHRLQAAQTQWRVTTATPVAEADVVVSVAKIARPTPATIDVLVKARRGSDLITVHGIGPTLALATDRAADHLLMWRGLTVP